MTGDAITLNAIGKCYRLHHASHRPSLAEMLGRRLRRLAGTPSEAAVPPFWALRDVSFTVGEGEVLALLGRNGSGKSTLLKVLARITPPSEGTAELQGRVGALLEVGTGFHPDLTGRENVRLNGAILGLSRDDVDDRMDEILAFSEIGDFADLPVKHYSSGMFARLAFSVMAHLDADILLVDEVTAVGDAGFARKSLAKIREMVRSGRTVVYVSHDMRAVRQLCDRGAVLDRGELVLAGPVEACIRHYERLCQDGPDIPPALQAV
jgi:lipopolysaccharide transport system ATP-binding protein